MFSTNKTPMDVLATNESLTIWCPIGFCTEQNIPPVAAIPFAPVGNDYEILSNSIKSVINRLHAENWEFYKTADHLLCLFKFLVDFTYMWKKSDSVEFDKQKMGFAGQFFSIFVHIVDTRKINLVKYPRIRSKCEPKLIKTSHLTDFHRQWLLTSKISKLFPDPLFNIKVWEHKHNLWKFHNMFLEFLEAPSEVQKITIFPT